LPTAYWTRCVEGMKAVGFCPGHITGLFYPCPHEDVLSSGSRGAGMCVHLGARSEVSLNESGEVHITINGKSGTAAVTRAAVKEMLPPGTGVTVDTMLELPMGSGFGMSAAGALSATIALADLLDLSRQEAFEAAHRAEISSHSGLGDVAGLMAGGIELRKREGIPPVGEVVRLADHLDIVACVVGPRMSTAAVLGSGSDLLPRTGRECHRLLMEEPTLERFLQLCRGFAERSGIITEPVRRALNKIDGLGPCSMVMLGNSVFAARDLDRQEAILKEFGPTYRLHLDLEGPRVIRRE